MHKGLSIAIELDGNAIAIAIASFGINTILSNIQILFLLCRKHEYPESDVSIEITIQTLLFLED